MRVAAHQAPQARAEGVRDLQRGQNLAVPHQPRTHEAMRS